ncbi:GNAT family N-acetyltransferase [Actinoplanes palleronii]|uniref:Acetyltransferase n=1 Tax=Actinoplanes palleronii TaxID=113570 RepID=A0ABQ4B8U8_9ACTN|nr:GNAT family N-acetyltransferase [Actinoplanes palleronii]GIE67064.1 acetyltransferase [Actinoplanes palleronii]
MTTEIRDLTLDDLPACLALAQDRAWLPEEHKWRLLFDVGTVYGVRDEAGGLVGTTVLTRFGGGLAAISMVLVAGRCGGRGLGRRLMEHALVAAGEATVILWATEYGRPLYEKLGFVVDGLTHTYAGRFSAPASDGGAGSRPAVPASGGAAGSRPAVPASGGAAGSRPAVPADLPALIALDAEVAGADRGELVRRLPGFTEQLRVVERGGVISGYGGAWRNLAEVVVGPVVAGNLDDARTLIGDLAGAVSGGVRLDLDDRHPSLLGWAAERGLALRRSTVTMVRGGRELPGERGRWFAPVMQALG